MRTFVVFIEKYSRNEFTTQSLHLFHVETIAELIEALVLKGVTTGGEYQFMDKDGVLDLKRLLAIPDDELLERWKNNMEPGGWDMVVVGELIGTEMKLIIDFP